MGLTHESNMEKDGHGGLVLGPIAKIGGLVDNCGVQIKAHDSPSVKGKKAMARNRASIHFNKAAANTCKPFHSPASLVSSFLSRNGADESSSFQFSSASLAELGNFCQGRDHGEHSGSSRGLLGEDGAVIGVVQAAPDGRLEASFFDDVKESKTGLSIISGTIVEEVGREGDAASKFSGSDLTRERSSKALNGKDDGDGGGDRMEFEEEGGFVTSSC